MSRTDLPIPSRVLLVAAAIIVGLGVLWWLVVESSPGSPGDPAAPPPPAVEERPEIDPADVELPAAESGEARDAGDRTGDEGLEDGPGAGSPAAEIPTERVTFNLYYPQDGTARLAQVVRRREAPLSLAAQAERAVRLLASPPEGRTSPFPPDTRVREVWVSEQGIAYVDLGEEIEALPGGSLAELHAVYSIVNTLTTSFPQIQAVQILVEGEEVETLTGHLDLSRPIRRSADW